ncbi:hypothetical protein [uncultured Shewanella sp.]|uniref:hypothetical protein n=1 Tax=uncultured Shewanella sp. TaxID=173975 RepID=UPI00262C4EF4|nr:hypothetical protein [uncultured Shewanella sp.]
MARKIKSRVYRQCMKDGRLARIQAELTRLTRLRAANLAPLAELIKCPLPPSLYSHHATRQSFFNKGWHAVTLVDILTAEKITGDQAC